MSRAVLSTSRVKEDLGQAVRYAEMQQVPHWSLDQHVHRQEFMKIIHEATEGVAFTKVKPRKPYVTDAILEVSVHRARLIKIKHREEQQVKRFDSESRNLLKQRLEYRPKRAFLVNSNILRRDETKHTF